MRKSKSSSRDTMSPTDGVAQTVSNSGKKTRLIVPWLIVVFAIILIVPTHAMVISQEIPTIRGGGGSIRKTDDALKLYRFYTKMNTAATRLPDSMDEALYTVDQDTKERSLVFFYRFGQTNCIYPIKDNPNQVVKYLDGWIITPDLCLHDITSHQLESYDTENEQLGYQWECRWDEQDCTLKPSYRALFPLAVRLRIWQEANNLNPIVVLSGLCFLDLAVMILAVVYLISFVRRYLIRN